MARPVPPRAGPSAQGEQHAKSPQSGGRRAHGDRTRGTGQAAGAGAIVRAASLRLPDPSFLAPITSSRGPCLIRPEVVVVYIQRRFAWLALFLVVGLPFALAACGKGGTGGY